MSSIDYPLPKEINSKSFEVKQTARWFHLGQQPSDCGKILIALHGYGQHPAYMMESLKPLLDSIENLCIVAPEGLSRFYIKGTDGRVGASWMTRDDRVQDIKDNIYYLNSWWDSIEVKSETEIILLGFSQGVATAGRWLADGFGSDKVIFHSGSIPAEWQDDAPSFNTRINKWTILRGDSDNIYPEETHKATATLFERLSLNFESLSFDGSHKMTAQHLKDLI